MVADGPDTARLFGFDSPFLQRLERLALLSRRPLPGLAAGPRRSPRRGSSVEFADFRDYSQGDDFRRIDWKAYGRLDRLFLRLYTAEEMTTLTLFLDRSASMSFGHPPKSLFAARLAAIFSYIALRSYDLVAVAGWCDKLDVYHPPRGGVAAIPDVWSSIGRVAGLVPQNGPAAIPAEPRGTDFSALRQFSQLRSGRSAGLAIVLSDVMTDSDWAGGIRALRAAGQEVSMIQVLAPEEIDPEIRGDWKLQDVETNREVEITASPRLLKRYLEELEAHTREVENFCRRQGAAFLQIRSDVPLNEVVLGQLHAAGMVA